MDKLMLYRQAIKNLLKEYADLSAADKDVDTQLLFDETHDHYQLMHVGWINGQRIYGSVIHLDLINGKVWLQHNGTEGDIAQELMAGGVAREDIVLGFRSPAVRVHTGYAVA
ncbi:MAG: XisI protein [Candidatus Thiothrix sulfatifontis]|nr:MAG: XisI protein [Candidatus Thiothrix sulfatifontis]